MNEQNGASIAPQQRDQLNEFFAINHRITPTCLQRDVVLTSRVAPEQLQEGKMSWLEHVIVLSMAKPISRVAAALIVSSSFYLAAEPLHDQITEAIIGLASEDVAVRQRAIDFLRSAPPEFRENMESQYRSEAQALAQSLPQQIDAYTTIQSVFLTNSEMQITYALHFNSGEYPNSDLQAIKSNLSDQTKTQICHTPGSVLLSLLYGKEVVRNYFYSDGKPFYSIRIGWQDCQ